MMNLSDFIPAIPKDQKYWFIRTNGGDYYDDFVNEGFVGIGWNKIELQHLKVNTPLSSIVKEYYTDETRYNHAANQIKTFSEIEKGDIVLIPSTKSTYIHFGIIDDDEAYEEDIPKELEDIDHHPELLFDYEGICPYRKRRKVNWIKVRKRGNLDPHLFKLIYSQQTISSANNYAEYIDRALFDFFIKGEDCHLVLHVEKKGNIKAKHLIPFMADLLALTETGEGESSQEDVDIKVTVQSPGSIEIIGYIPWIIAVSLAIVGVLGGKTKFLGFELDTPGVVGRILEWKRGKGADASNIPELPQQEQERMAQNAENIELKLPEDFKKAFEKYITEANKEISSTDDKKEE
jgi:restriction system protein